MRRFEISLWDNCNNGCKFCWTFNSVKSNKVNIENKLQAINKTYELLEQITSDDDLLLTGGELFDLKPSEPEVIQQLNSLFDKIFLNLLLKKFHHLFIITNLINSNPELIQHLYTLINSLPTLDKERIHITTSYDVVGRFHTKFVQEEFFRHLQQFSSLLIPQNIVINTILTKSACKALLTKELDILQLQKEYNCSWHVIPFVSNIPDETPTKDEVFKVLKQLEDGQPGYLKQFSHDINHLTESIYLKLRGQEVINSTVENLSCGHSKNFTHYATDTDSCFMCDIDKAFNITNKSNGYISIELWPDCKINCPFCFNTDRKKIPTSDKEKVRCINDVITYLKENYYRYKTIQIMGGEFFNGELENPEVLQKFIELCKLLNTLATERDKYICIYSALKNTFNLKEVMDVLVEGTDQDKIKFNSSFNYNITHNDITTKEFVDKVLQLRSDYPQIKIHIQSLLSDKLINMPFDEVLDLYSPFLSNNIEVDFHPVTIIGINTWTERSGEKFRELLRTNPITKDIAIKSRDKALAFCVNLYNNFGPDCFQNFRVNTTRAETKWLVVPNVFEENISTSDLHCDNTKCGHTYHMANAYLDSDECLSCDINKLMETME